MKRWHLSVGLLSLAIIAGIWVIFSPEPVEGIKEIKVGSSNEEPVARIFGDGLQFVEKEQTEGQWATAHDNVYSYKAYDGNSYVGRVSLTERRLQNGDTIYYSSFVNEGNDSHNVTFTYPAMQAEMTSFASAGETIEHKHDNTVGVDPTTIPVGYATLKDGGSAWLGQRYESSVLRKEYSGDQSSILRDFQNESNPYATKENQLEQTLVAKEDSVAESWFMRSEEELFSSSKKATSWAEDMAENYRWAKKWLTPDGVYQKIPWSIEPGTKMGYGRVIGALPHQDALSRFEQTGERYFESMSLNAVTTIEAYRSNQDTELWKTEYTSTWVQKAYGIHAPYTDTRHNEKLSLFLMNASEVLGLESIGAESLKYADYLVAQSNDGNIISFGDDAFLVGDYDGPGKEEVPHASLNHALGESYYLLKAYDKSGDEKYLELAYSIRKAIETIGSQWIREEGDHSEDLWYQVNEDHTFEGNDYQLLTLVDLHKNQKLWAETKYGESDTFDTLIESKTSYLERTGLDVEQAVNERISP
ncbi:hypothetical protein [Pontibacillus salipaludis]|uniref:hypothetical protein n=1 Tax=Pontibacillus salipaludis TaxID=1697394 RepID=UPI0031EF1C0E